MSVTLKRPYKAVFAAVGAAALVIKGASISNVGDRYSVERGGPRVLRSVLSLPRVNSSSSSSGSERRQLRRGSDGDEEKGRLECILSQYEFLYEGSFDPNEVFMCSPMQNGVASSEEYQVEINEDMRNKYREIVKGGHEPILSITRATIDEGNARINLAKRSEMELVNHRRRRRLLATQGRLTALTVRVVLNDEGPVYSKEELYRLMYQDKVSLKNQYKSCSFGKLVIEPSSAGVIEVTVNLPKSISSHQTVVNAASLAAIEYLHENNYGGFSHVRDYADMVLYILPNMGKWLAYGSVGGGTSVYNDKWGGFVASIMHETGHNFNLLHAFEGDGEYDDYTGYMGGAIVSYHDKVGFPAMCFNAQNHWQLGWFQDRAIETDLFTPTKVRVAAFVDYEKTTGGLDYVLVRSGNVFMHYNRAKAINQDTYEYQDHLVIYQGITEGTALFAALSYPDNAVFQKSFPQGTWWAEICEKVEGDSNTPDYLVVSIGFGTSSLCGVSQLVDVNSNDAQITEEWENSGMKVKIIHGT